VIDLLWTRIDLVVTCQRWDKHRFVNVDLLTVLARSTTQSTTTTTTATTEVTATLSSETPPDSAPGCSIVLCAIN